MWVFTVPTLEHPQNTHPGTPPEYPQNTHPGTPLEYPPWNTPGIPPEYPPWNTPGVAAAATDEKSRRENDFQVVSRQRVV